MENRRDQVAVQINDAKKKNRRRVRFQILNECSPPPLQPVTVCRRYETRAS